MSTITSDLASKVIAADLRNLVKRVSEGESLSGPEREMMEKAVIDGTLPDDLQEARLAALARLYALGKNLSKSQQAELSSLIPVGRAIVKRLTTETYKFKLAHYVKQFGIDGKDPRKKLKRWLEAGRKQSPPDLPPFDAPEKMAEWWRRCMEIRVPEFMLKLEAGEAQPQEPGQPASPPSADPAKPGEPTEIPGIPMMFDTGTEMTADLGIIQIRSLVIALFKRMQEHFEAGRATEAQSVMRQWERAVENLRKWEKDLTKIQEGKGEVLRARVINTELGRVFGVMGQSFFNAIQALMDKYAADLPAADRRKFALEYKDKCFQHLKSSRFATIYHPEE